MRAWLLAVALLLSGCAGCATSHGREDGGGTHDVAWDAGPPDEPRMRRDVGAPLPDGDLPDGTDCSEVAGIRRCGLAQCPYLCPGTPPERCATDVPLCLPRRESCTYQVGDFTAIPRYCAMGWPCVMSGDPPPAADQSGTCLPLDAVELCLTDAREADLPPFHCVWTDMTRVTRAPPPAACPPAADPRAPFCSGACELTDCPPPAYYCVGLSDTRGFGVCTYATPCYEDAPSALRVLWDDCERDPRLRPCACLIPMPQPPEAPFPRGLLASATACLAYEAAYPGGVQCRDREWRRLPPP